MNRQQRRAATFKRAQRWDRNSGRRDHRKTYARRHEGNTMTQEIKFSDLPKLGTAMRGGTFAGLTSRKDGSHCAVILLPDQGTDLTWAKACTWAEKLDAELPTRPVAALLFATLKDQLRPKWHWTSESYDASCAWLCYFLSGHQSRGHNSYEGAAVAVRLIPIGG